MQHRREGVACLPVCVFVCVHACEVRALSVEFHVEAAVRLRRSRGGEQRGRKTTSPLFFPSIFPQAHFFSPLSFELRHFIHSNRGCHIPHCLSEGVCAALCSAPSAMYNCSRVLLLCQECSQTHRHSALARTRTTKRHR